MGQTTMRNNPPEDSNARDDRSCDQPPDVIRTALRRSESPAAERRSLGWSCVRFSFCVSLSLSILTSSTARAQTPDQSAPGPAQSAIYDQALSAARAAMDREAYDEAASQ